jgi:hypothetical protein
MVKNPYVSLGWAFHQVTKNYMDSLSQLPVPLAVSKIWLVTINTHLHLIRSNNTNSKYEDHPDHTSVNGDCLINKTSEAFEKKLNMTQQRDKRCMEDWESRTLDSDPPGPSSIMEDFFNSSTNKMKM